jgi:hypothetical protein
VTPEGKVKAKVKQILKNLGAYYVMPVTGGYGNSGAPDFLVCYKGAFVGIECKAGRGKATALQLSNLDQIIETGGHSFLINEANVNELTQLMELIK